MNTPPDEDASLDVGPPSEPTMAASRTLVLAAPPSRWLSTMQSATDLALGSWARVRHGTLHGSSPRGRHWPWLAVAAADAGIVLYGLSALRRPMLLAAGYESHAGEPWGQLADGSPGTAAHLLLAYRLIGALDIGLGLALVSLAAGPLRRHERWAWYALLTGNLIGYGAPMTYDQRTGAIGPFEILEFAGLGLVVAGLAGSARSCGVVR